MTEPQDANLEPGASPSPYLRLPVPALATILLAFLGTLLAFGLYANANLRPGGIVIQPTPAPAAAVPLAQATPTAVAAAKQPSPARALTPTPVANLRATATPPSARATVEATEVPTPLVTVFEATATPARVADTGTPGPLPTVEPTLAAEIGTAYEAYWRVTSDALLDLDPTHLADVMEGPYLQQFETQIEDLTASGRAIKTKVTLNYKVVQVIDATAVVVDRVEDDSYYVRPGTDDPVSDPSNDLLRLEVKLRNDTGTWKVVESASAD